MKQMLFVAIFVLRFTSINAQSLSDSMSSYFNYDTLGQVDCAMTPPGVYSMIFKINSSKEIYDLSFSADSLDVLKSLLISAMQRCVNTTGNYKKNKQYFQLIYYNNYLACTTTDTSAISNLETERANFLGSQVAAIERSFRRTVDHDEERIVLRPVVINNWNPNKIEKSRFRNDNKVVSDTDIPKEKLDQIEREVNRRRAKSAKESGNGE